MTKVDASTQHVLMIAQELGLKIYQVEAVNKLLLEDATIPFIARYRKEVTGSLDEVVIGQIRDRIQQLEQLDSRREAIKKSLEERNLLTEFLQESIINAKTLTELEDIYQPYRPKRRTRATIAKEKGLENLADFILNNQVQDPCVEAEKYIDQEKGVNTVEEALAGARDIIAEWVSDDARARAEIRMLFESQGVLVSEVIPGKEEEGAKFRDYFKWSELMIKAPSHRILAIRRGEQEGFLHLRIQVPEMEAVTLLEKIFVKVKHAGGAQVALAVQDSFKRLLGPSLETEARIQSKERADIEAVRVFADNLRELLLASPLGQKTVLAIDPGFRTGCKVVCLDAQGKLLHHDVVYLGQSARQEEEAKMKIVGFCKQFNIQAIAIGNGTASRETETFVRAIGLGANVAIVVVNESGASIYSASEVAREEFPDHDITVRGSVSIGRRLMDPLAELVKLDPKSIGVGQYQHDVDQALLKKNLDDVVVSCVNKVGVEVNTASKQLLSYVSGLNATIANNIIQYRNEHGAFKSRDNLKKVPRLGPKAFEQAAGFLRIRDGLHPLDSSAVHPESYGVVEAMAKDQNCSIEELINNGQKRANIRLENYVTDTIGLPTLKDILAELAKPGRDPRKEFQTFSFAEGVHKLEDLKLGMKLPGIVTNVTAFGAFVDIGVHQDGLVHISQLSDNFIKDPSEAVKVQQKVMVTVIEVDIPRKRIALSMKTVQTQRMPQDIKKDNTKNYSTNREKASSVSFNNDWFSQALSKKK